MQKKSYIVLINKGDGSSTATHRVEAKTFRLALVAATPYNADDYKLRYTGADGAKWFATERGTRACVMLARNKRLN